MGRRDALLRRFETVRTSRDFVIIFVSEVNNLSLNFFFCRSTYAEHRLTLSVNSVHLKFIKVGNPDL